MKGWGSAGRGLYWRPTLSVRVCPRRPGPVRRVSGLFVDSGLDMHESRTAGPRGRRAAQEMVEEIVRWHAGALKSNRPAATR